MPDRLGTLSLVTCSVLALLLLGAMPTGVLAQEEAEKEEVNLFGQLEYRHIVPVGNRVSAVVGVAGDLEHGGAMIHPKLGKPMRAAVGGGKALIPSNAKVAAAGTSIDLPLGHKDEAWSFDHFDTMTVMIADAPRPDEIVLCMAVSDGGRPHPRVGSGPITN